MEPLIMAHTRSSIDLPARATFTYEAVPAITAAVKVADLQPTTKWGD
jgi:hypothetical protein